MLYVALDTSAPVLNQCLDLSFCFVDFLAGFCHVCFCRQKPTKHQLCIECQDGATFSFPYTDCIELPIAHSTVEELAEYFYNQIYRKLGDTFVTKGVYKVEVIVSEAPGQSGSFIQEL